MSERSPHSSLAQKFPWDEHIAEQSLKSAASLFKTTYDFSKCSVNSRNINYCFSQSQFSKVRKALPETQLRQRFIIYQYLVQSHYFPFHSSSLGGFLWATTLRSWINFISKKSLKDAINKTYWSGKSQSDLCRFVYFSKSLTLQLYPIVVLLFFFFSL